MECPWKRLRAAAWLVTCLVCCFSSNAETGTSLNLVWSPSAQSNVVGYRVYYGQGSREYTKTIDVGNATSADLPDLTSGVTYFIAVTAYDNLGFESLPSNEISFTIPGTAPGLYTGLFSEAGGPQPGRAGSFNLVLSSGGAYSGMLQMGTKRVGFSGKLDEQSSLVQSVRRPSQTSLSMRMNVGSGVQAGQVQGQISDGSWTATAVGYRAPYNARRFPAPFSGSYTLIIPGQDGGPPNVAGNGFGTARVSAGGVVRVQGVLADGTRYTQAATLSGAGQWPVFVSILKGQGLLSGWIVFQQEANSDLGGALTWIRPAGLSAASASELTVAISQSIGSSYSVLDGLAGMSVRGAPFEAIFSGGDLTADFTNPCVMIDSSHAGSLSASGLTLKFSPSTGTFRGKVVDPTSGEWLSFGGAAFQKLNFGYGFVLVPSSRSGRVVLSPD